MPSSPLACPAGSTATDLHTANSAPANLSASSEMKDTALRRPCYRLRTPPPPLDGIYWEKNWFQECDRSETTARAGGGRQLVNAAAVRRTPRRATALCLAAGTHQLVKPVAQKYRTTEESEKMMARHAMLCSTPRLAPPPAAIAPR